MIAGSDALRRNRALAAPRPVTGFLTGMGIVKALAAERPGKRTDAERRHELKRWLTISKCAIGMPFVSLIFPPPQIRYNQ